MQRIQYKKIAFVLVLVIKLKVVKIIIYFLVLKTLGSCFNNGFSIIVLVNDLVLVLLNMFFLMKIICYIDSKS